jgi:hypothetical protein
MLRSMSVANFKQLSGAAKFDFLINPKTDKLFVSGDNGMNYKAEAAIDYKKPIVVLIDGDDMDTACFINERTAVKPVHTL